jgi:hypothetical protein
MGFPGTGYAIASGLNAGLTDLIQAVAQRKAEARQALLDQAAQQAAEEKRQQTALQNQFTQANLNRLQQEQQDQQDQAAAQKVMSMFPPGTPIPPDVANTLSPAAQAMILQRQSGQVAPSQPQAPLAAPQGPPADPTAGGIPVGTPSELPTPATTPVAAPQTITTRRPTGAEAQTMRQRQAVAQFGPEVQAWVDAGGSLASFPGFKPQTGPQFSAEDQAVLAAAQAANGGAPLTPAQMTAALDAHAAHRAAATRAPADTPLDVPPPMVGPPDAATGNKPDPNLGGLTPTGVYQAGMEYALTGKMPSLGLGAKGAVKAQRAAIINQGGALAQAAGVSIPEVQAAYNGNKAALQNINIFAGRTDIAAQTADKNLQLALEKSGSVPRSQMPAANRFLLWAKGQLGDKDIPQFQLYVYTAAREYAKVVSGSAASTQGLTDTANQKVDQLVSAAQNPAQFAAVVQGMQNDMQNVQDAQREEVAQRLATVSPVLGRFYAVANGVRMPTAETTPSSAGLVQMRAPDGTVKAVPASKVEHYKALGATVIGGGG